MIAPQEQWWISKISILFAVPWTFVFMMHVNGELSKLGYNVPFNRYREMNIL